MSNQTQLLSELARQALEQYGADLKAGGEPIYPKWAEALQGVLATQEQLVAALGLAEEVAQVGIFNAAKTDLLTRCAKARRAALAAAGA